MLDNTVRMTCPTDLLASVPLLLGFVPEESVVVLSLRGSAGALGMTARVDLPQPQEAADVAEEMFGHAQRDGASAVVVVIYTGDTDPVARPVIAEVSAVLRAVGAEQGVPVGAVWHVGPVAYTRLHGSGPGPRAGLVDDLRDSRAAAELVMHGYTAAASREALTAVLDVTDPVRVGEVAGMIERAFAVPADRRGTQGFMVWAMETARAQVAGPRPEIAAEPAALMLAAMTSASVRDAFLVSCVPGQEATAEAMAGGDPQAGAEVLARFVFGAAEGVAPAQEVTVAAAAVLRSLVRQAPLEVSAEPLALLAVLAWWSGSWAMAGECAQRALTASPEHRLATLALAVMGAGVQPGWMTARRAVHLDTASV